MTFRSDPDLIRAAIAAGGLSSRRFAEALMGRDERTIRRWVAGEVAIPPIARDWLTHWLGLSDATRRRIAGALTARRATPPPPTDSRAGGHDSGPSSLST